MASVKLSGCAIDVEAKEDGGGEEISQSGIQPDVDAVSLSVFSPPYFHFIESISDSGSASMDSEPDLHNCFIDFFDRESYEVDTVREFSPIQSPSTSGAFNTCGLYDTDDEIELRLGIGSGSGSGQLSGDSGLEVTGNGEIDSGLTPVSEEAMVADEEVEWEDLQNAIHWVQEDGEDLSVAPRYDDHEDMLDWPFAEEFEDYIVDSGVMDFEYALNYQPSIEEYGGDYNAMFDNEAGIMGSPPASKRVVDDLPLVEITSEVLRSNGNIVCAICKDEVVVEEKVKRLPCRHYYHGECIIPWLGIRNTCPVCRYELPTDDLEYERNRRRSQRRSSSSDLMSE